MKERSENSLKIIWVFFHRKKMTIGKEYCVNIFRKNLLRKRERCC